MWLIFAAGSAFFAGITSILAKCGIRKTDSDTATAIRTIAVTIFSWIMASITAQDASFSDISMKSWIFLILSGLATGTSWHCYFHALQYGDINKVVPIDKSSTVITMILAMIFLGEGITAAKTAAIFLIGIGTLLMIERKDAVNENIRGSWIIYALLSALFASLTSILGKIGIEGVPSDLGTAIRTTVVLVMAWLIVFMKGKQKNVRNIPKNELAFIILSGIATGASWLCYYRALQQGPASVVVPIDKLSILITILFSRIVFGEKLSTKSASGLLMIFAGTMIMAIPSIIG